MVIQLLMPAFETITAALKYDFDEEKECSYKDKTIDEAIKNLCRFTSNIWQIHPFCEGNTRSVAVFILNIKDIWF